MTEFDHKAFSAKGGRAKTSKPKGFAHMKLHNPAKFRAIVEKTHAKKAK